MQRPVTSRLEISLVTRAIPFVNGKIIHEISNNYIWEERLGDASS